MKPLYGSDHPTDLSKAAEREEVHKRRICCNGFVRRDGLFDIEAELTDHKTYSFPSDFRGEVTPDMPFHHMKVRLTITRDLIITAAEAVTIAGPYAVCPMANDVFANLVGIQIGPGWRRKVSAAIGGQHGCTHITELMGPVATIAYQTRYGEESRRARQLGNYSKSGNDNPEDANSRSQRSNVLANSCVAYAVEES